jgi:LPS-assembly protein
VRAALAIWLLLVPAWSGAQPPAPAQDATPAAQSDAAPPARTDTSEFPDCDADRQEIAPERWLGLGAAACLMRDGARMTGDRIDVAVRDGRTVVRATGNVSLRGPDGYIYAESAEYDTQAGTGLFTAAHGFLSLGPDADRTLFAGQDPEVEFYGQRLEKLGPKRFRVTGGGWTTCTQPEPRWEFTAGTMELELDRYVIARHTVLRVKGVPLFYWPFLYYPIQDDDRATGFLMPSYGTSTFRGQAISNAFFWAINRSQDATFVHDLFSRAGQGAGVEYRIVPAPGSSGELRVYRLARSETSFEEDGVVRTLPGATSHEVTGTLVQSLGRGIMARARVDYFSDVQSQQLLHQNLYDASRRSRLVEGGLTAQFGRLSTSVLYQRNELINGADDTLLYGSAPRVSASVAPAALFRSPIYASLNAEAAYLPYRQTVAGALVRDDSFGRVDLAPSVRLPLSRLSFLSVNTSASYRTTYYSRRADDSGSGTVDDGYLRQYGSFRTEVIGPVVSRIFDLGEGGFADRMKHVIEPAVSVDLTTPIGTHRRTPLQTDVSDFVVGGNARVTYGVTSRLFIRQAAASGARGTTREFFTVGLQQTSYSKPESSLYDTTYSSAIGVGGGRRRSPLALTARVSPSTTFDADTRAEYDADRGLQLFTTGASVNYTGGGANVNYSRQRIDPSFPATSFLSASTRVQLLQERVRANYTVSWDIARRYVVSQGITGAWMAQCCGIQAEYQQFNYPTGIGLPITADRRVNFAFVLGGLGTFSNFFGAFGGL